MRFLILLAALFAVGCGTYVSSMGSVTKFQGQAVDDAGTPIPNVLVVLQPIESGYEIELEANAQGMFTGEGIPGKYIYYFATSKKGKFKLPEEIPLAFLEPKMEHLVTIRPSHNVVCKVGAQSGM